MTEYEEITNDKSIGALEAELEYQLSLGFNLGDSFPQHIVNCIAKLKSEAKPKKDITIKYRGSDDWDRPVFQVVELIEGELIKKTTYLGSTNILVPDRKLGLIDVKSISEYFRNNIGALEYFGSTFNCEPMGSTIADNINLIIID